MGSYVGTGLSDQTVTVPRLGTVTHAVTVHLSNLALATRLKAIIESKGVHYRIRSTFYGQSWFNRMQSESAGKLDLKDFTPSLETTNAPRPCPPAALRTSVKFSGRRRTVPPWPCRCGPE